MYKIVSFRYESVIQKHFAGLRRANFFLPPPPPPQSQIRSYGLVVPYRTIFTAYTPVHISVLDRYSTAPPVHICNKCIAHSVPFRSDPRLSILWGSFRDQQLLFWYSLVRSVCYVDRWIDTVPEQVWTHAVPYRDPNCSGTVCTGTVPLQIWTG